MDKYDVTLDVCISSVLSQSMVLTPQVNNTRVLKVVLDNRINPWFSSIDFETLVGFSYAASNRKCRCLYRRRDGKLLEQKRCSESPPCKSCRRQPVACLQQVISY